MTAATRPASEVTVRAGSPREPAATTLLQASHRYLASLYPAEHNHYLSIDALAVPEIAFLIAEAEGTATGCAALADKGGYGEIKSMFVHADARGAGTGTALMDALERTAHVTGLAVLRLETGDTLRAAHRLYARHGFTVRGPFGDYAGGPHSVFMEKPL